MDLVAPDSGYVSVFALFLAAGTMCLTGGDGPFAFRAFGALGLHRVLRKEPVAQSVGFNRFVTILKIFERRVSAQTETTPFACSQWLTV